MQSISEWLHSLGLDQHAQVFVDNDIDLDVIPNLTEQDLDKLGVSMGHRKKLLKAIAEMNHTTTSAPGARLEASGPSPLATAQRLVADAGERRQLTVLFSAGDTTTSPVAMPMRTCRCPEMGTSNLDNTSLISRPA